MNPGADGNAAPGSKAERASEPTFAGRPAWILVTVALIAALLGKLAIVGDDSRWLAALGQIVVRDHAVPTGVPFAAASTAHWPNTLVLA